MIDTHHEITFLDGVYRYSTTWCCDQRVFTYTFVYDHRVEREVVELTRMLMAARGLHVQVGSTTLRAADEAHGAIRCESRVQLHGLEVDDHQGGRVLARLDKLLPAPLGPTRDDV